MLSEKQILKTSAIIWKAIENIHEEEKHQATDADACDICLNSYPIRVAVWAEAETRKNNKPKDGNGLNLLTDDEIETIRSNEREDGREELSSDILSDASITWISHNIDKDKILSEMLIRKILNMAVLRSKYGNRLDLREVVVKL